MPFDEVAQHLLQLRGVHAVAAPLGGPDVVDHHMAHQQFAIGPADQPVAELERDDLRQMLVLARISSSLSSHSSRQSSNLSILLSAVASRIAAWRFMWGSP